MTTQDQIEAQRAKFRANGIGTFSINGLPEDESIAQYLDEKFSFFFALVRHLYGRNAKLPNWRLFAVSKKKPQLPMGYYGCPGFTFECYDGTAGKTAQEILIRLMPKSYTFSKRDEHQFAMKEIAGQENPLFYKINEESQKYLKNHSVVMLKWN